MQTGLPRLWLVKEGKEVSHKTQQPLGLVEDHVGTAGILGVLQCLCLCLTDLPLGLPHLLNQLGGGGERDSFSPMYH